MAWQRENVYDSMPVVTSRKRETWECKRGRLQVIRRICGLRWSLWSRGGRRVERRWRTVMWNVYVEESTEVDRRQKENLLMIFWLKYRPGGKFGNEIKGQGRQRGIWATFQPSLSTRMHNQRSSFCIIFLGSLCTNFFLKCNQNRWTVSGISHVLK